MSMKNYLEQLEHCSYSSCLFNIWFNDKKAKKEAKKVVSSAKFKAYDDPYYRLGTREGERGIFKLAKIRERKSRDLDHVKCIKSNDQKVLVKDNDIKERWMKYFGKLLNEDYVGEWEWEQARKLCCQNILFSAELRW